MNNDQLMTRRCFMKSAAVASAGVTLPSFLNNSIYSIMAQEDPDASAGDRIPGFKNNRVLVVVQLSGGNDGLNTVIPYRNKHYYNARPSLYVPKKKRIRVNEQFAFHENLKEIRDMYDRGMVSVINGVGYPNPSRSHFRSMKVWHTAAKSGEEVKERGWIGRYFDNCCDGQGNHPSSAAGVNVGKDAPEAFKGNAGIGVSVQDPADFQWTGQNHGDDMESAFESMARSNQDNTGADNIDYLRQQTANFVMSSEEMHRSARRKRNKPSYPDTGLASDLEKVAGMIAAEMPTRVYYVSLGGFDTHDNQKGRHDKLLETFSKAVHAFYKDLKMNDNAHRVTTMSFSEFGRRVEENGSGGTDHGKAGPMFVIGDGINPGLHGKFAGIKPEQRENGDLKHTVDFRQVYAGIMNGWFDVNPEQFL
jgi:uncharacterized protein (DUF1501 family)